jgi:hypothetical protein
MLGAALRYAARGWPVFPMFEPVAVGEAPVCSCPAGADCRSIGKHPRTTRGNLDATTDARTIRRMWAGARDANIGIRTGSGLLVLDLDGHDAAEWMAAHETRNGSLPQTPEAVTAQGVHIYLTTDRELRNPSPAHRVDTRCDGGAIVAPPSLHRTGHRYRWRGGLTPDDVAVAAAPDWLLALLDPPRVVPVRDIIRRRQHERTPFTGEWSIDAWMTRYLPDASGPKAWKGGRRWILEACPWNPEHNNAAAFVVELPGGAIGAGCHHNGCAGRGWPDLRALFEDTSRRRTA